MAANGLIRIIDLHFFFCHRHSAAGRSSSSVTQRLSEFSFSSPIATASLVLLNLLPTPPLNEQYPPKLHRRTKIPFNFAYLNQYPSASCPQSAVGAPKLISFSREHPDKKRPPAHLISPAPANWSDRPVWTGSLYSSSSAAARGNRRNRHSRPEPASKAHRRRDDSCTRARAARDRWRKTRLACRSSGRGEKYWPRGGGAAAQTDTHTHTRETCCSAEEVGAAPILALSLPESLEALDCLCALYFDSHGSRGLFSSCFAGSLLLHHSSVEISPRPSRSSRGELARGEQGT